MKNKDVKPPFFFPLQAPKWLKHKPLHQCTFHCLLQCVWTCRFPFFSARLSSVSACVFYRSLFKSIRDLCVRMLGPPSRWHLNNVKKLMRLKRFGRQMRKKACKVKMQWMFYSFPYAFFACVCLSKCQVNIIKANVNAANHTYNSESFKCNELRRIFTPCRCLTSTCLF